jgi:hypothetical protein
MIFAAGVLGKEGVSMKTLVLAAAASLCAALCLSQTPQASALPPGGASTGQHYDVAPQARVRLNGRWYGIYLTVTRYISGAPLEGGSNILPIQVNATLFPLDGQPVPPTLPQSANITLIRTQRAWFSRGQTFRWTLPLTLVPAITLGPTTSTMYVGSGEPGSAWDNARVTARIEFAGRDRTSVVVPNVVIGLVPLP